MHTYLASDFPNYSELFRAHAIRMVELMRIVDETLKTDLDMVTVRPKDLYTITNELLYDVDEIYKKEHNIADNDYSPISYRFNDSTISEMRTMLRDELKNYFAEQHDSE